jgi:tetratricopeptide (TPR) repeat protein
LDLFNEAAVLADSIGDRSLAAMTAFNFGYAALEAGDIDKARADFETATTAPDPYLAARAHAAAGSAAFHADDTPQAARHLRESLQILLQLGQYEDTAAWALELHAAVIVDTATTRAVQLLGAAERMREELGLSQQGIELELHECSTTKARIALGDEAVAVAWAAGRALSRAEAIITALDAPFDADADSSN